ncbi:class I SAM-dependent methyltransferase [Microvirga arsenatis]|uniref:Methyltransferase domain-containing protein n=1 Tax=Microvirga arsenatis TaxID=2692265 RepID=A0ABW9YYQ6_9HYPH|nr:methyltransferase domain-containing protein [Microvirga arsenatis]NBJ11241.1 methyltransferase domain-containing protein [Microvirga arsenatis]NBJ25514.1 methyltransferase domain-containing protein [Microvirga arsenatis]
MTANYTLRDEIRDYWSLRAPTFDEQVGHEIFSEAERQAWRDLFLRHLGSGEGRRALDLASGTGVISHLLYGLGFEVTGLDWSEAMLAQARAKAARRGAAIRFVMGDAERTLEKPESYDVLVTRHLVWTLVDPKAAFREWHSLLRPGGRLLIVDGDFVSDTLVRRAIRLVERILPGLAGAPHAPNGLREMHERILKRVYFSKGARAQEVAALLREAGFAQIAIDRNLRDIHREQAKNLPLLKGLERATQHRYAILAVKA